MTRADVFDALSERLGEVMRTAQAAGLRATGGWAEDWRCGTRTAGVTITYEIYRPTDDDLARMIGWTWPLPPQAVWADASPTLLSNHGKHGNF